MNNIDRTLFNENNFKKDNIRAVDAKFEAQKIAFAPLAFQAVRAMIDLGVLKAVEDADTSGISIDSLAEKTELSKYALNVLCEIALCMDIIKLSEKSDQSFILGKIGWFLLEDELTKVNFNFTNDVCYQGAWALTGSLKNGKPEGLKVFGENWNTIYEALAHLPAKAKKSWFDFDHFYSDIAFPEALPIVFKNAPKHIADIGGNTAKWAICCCRFDPEVKVTIVDLPGQTAEAEKNAVAAGFSQRIQTISVNMLHPETKLPNQFDAIWMSQFLDCFSLEQITEILKKVYEIANPDTYIYILEPLWDKQKFSASTYSLTAVSLYFTCMANGNSKMYRYSELVEAAVKAGLELQQEYHDLGSNNYSLLVLRKKV